MKKFLWLWLLALCFSCSSKQGGTAVEGSDTQASVSVNLVDYIEGGKENAVVLSELVDSLGYVPLQTPEELPIDVLLSVKMSSRYIFVLDRQQKLYRFDHQGRFLNLIGSRGEGPEVAWLSHSWGLLS